MLSIMGEQNVCLAYLFCLDEIDLMVLIGNHSLFRSLHCLYIANLIEG